MRDGKLWMRSLGTLKRVDVVLRRVDADYADPLDLRADSRLGVVGLVEVQRRGAVTVVNTLGSGILESPGLHALSARTGRAAARGDAAAGDRADVLGRHRRGTLASAGAPGVAVDQLDSRGRIRSSARRCRRRSGEASPRASRRRRGSGSARSCPSSRPRPRTTTAVGCRPASVGHAVVHGVPARRLRADDRRPGLRAGARGNAAYKLKTVAAKDVWVRPPTRAGAERRSPTARRSTCPPSRPADPGDQLAARAVRPVLDGPLRRAGREHGPAADRDPRALPRIPLPSGPRRQRVRAGAARRARARSPAPTPAPTVTTPR